MRVVSWKKQKCGVCGAPLFYKVDDVEGIHGVYCPNGHSPSTGAIEECPFCSYPLEGDLEAGADGSTHVVEICPNPYCYNEFMIRTPQEEKLPDLEDLEDLDLDDEF